MGRVESVVRAWAGVGAIVVAVMAAGSVVACGSGAAPSGDPQGGAQGVPGPTDVPPPVMAADGGADAASGIVVVPPGKKADAGAHHPPAANDAGAQKSDGGSKPSKDAGGSPSGSTGDDASAPGSDDAGATGSSSSNECVTGSDCFSVPCGCSDGTTEYWQACGADGTCLGYGVCLNDGVCANNGGLYDPTAPPATCDANDPSDCAPVACACSDGTVLDYQACAGTACATAASCGADGDDVCSAHGGWLGDAPTPPATPCPDVQCACPDGVTYVIPDENCLGSGACGTDLVCSGDS